MGEMIIEYAGEVNSHVLEWSIASGSSLNHVLVHFDCSPAS